MNSSDTIAAISSAVGPAARMIVRLSGERAIEITESLAETSLISPAGRMRLGLSGLQIPAWIYLFRAPHSVTGENVAEINLPGNPLVARMTLDELIRRGARLAEPGEFTARAYFNGKLDLSQAEGVAAAIAAHSDAELAAARQLLAGELANRLRPIMAGIVQVLSLIEAGIDFVEEDINFISDAEARSQIQTIIAQLESLRQESARFEPLTHTPRFVLVGRPNAGKSTLLNLLAGHQRAVVSPIAGTTRDVLCADVPLRRGIIELADAAGLEEFSPDPPAASADHQIARDIHQRALRAVEMADRVVLVRELTDTRPDPSLPRHPDLVVNTKRDLTPPSKHPDLCISAITGEGVDELCKRLDDLAFRARGGGKIALNARHLKCIEESRESLTRAQNLIGHAGAELLALELRESLDAAGRILGEVTPDDVLGRIFSSFCIGK